MRRRSDTESSLDLLLDTICNMFGMVIFIAVLAAVLAAARGEARIEAAIAPTAHRQEALQLQLASLLSEGRADEQGVLDEIRSDIEEMEEEHALLAADVAMVQSRVGPQDPREQLERQRSDIESLEHAVRAAREAQQIPVRTPRRHTIENRVPVQIVLTKGRFYLVNDWSSWRGTRDPIDSRCVFWATWNAQAVDADASVFQDHGSCEYRTGGIGIDRVIQLRRDGGVDMDAATGEVAIAALLDQLDPRNQYLSFRVTPDSFGHWHAARRMAVDRGFHHNVEPITLDDELVYRDRIERGASIAQ